MKKTSRLILFTLILSLVLSMGFLGAPAKADEPMKISNEEELKAIKDNPSGSYVLASNIDLKGAEWTPFSFSGTLDGNGFAIMNYKITNVPSEKATVYDANLKDYQAAPIGFFTKMENATVKNLQLLGGDIACTTTDCAFMGTLAGYAYNSTVDNCIVIGKDSLTTSGHCAGVAGLIGFVGNSTISGCTIESILVYEDTDAEYKEEQFMGGVYAFGYGSVKNCKVRIDGYDADHGYVHNGGLIGTFMYYDDQNVGSVEIINNLVEGMITFYEDNEDRRAYCEAIIGEIMQYDYTDDNNQDDFTRNELDSYGTLTPHCACGSPSVTTQTVASRTGRAGYAIDMCSNCNYIYKYNFTAPLPGTYINPAVQSFGPQLEGCTDLLVFSSHADDEQLFFAGILPYYSQVRDLAVQVVYGTDPINEPERYAERENGLWNVGITNQCDTSGWLDLYAETIDQALENLMNSDGVSEEGVIEWIRQTILKYQPQVIITHDRGGEYAHGFHQMMSHYVEQCVNQYASEFPFLKKVYLHLAEENPISLSIIDQPYGALNGLTPFQVTQKYGFTEHKSQHWTWFYDWLYYGVDDTQPRGDEEIRYASQIGSYSPLSWGLVYGDPALDVNKNDFFEGLMSYAEIEAAKHVEPETQSSPIEPAKGRGEKISTKVIIIGIIALVIVIAIIIIIVLTNKKKKEAEKKRRAQAKRRRAQAQAQGATSEQRRTQPQQRTRDAVRTQQRPEGAVRTQQRPAPRRTSEGQSTEPGRRQRSTTRVIRNSDQKPRR